LFSQFDATVLDESNYKIVKTINYDQLNIMDFIGAGKKIIKICLTEYDDTTQTENEIKDICTRDAKYCPTDDTQ